MRENVGIFHQELEGVQRLVQWQPGSLLSNKSQSWTDPTNIHHGTSRSTRQMETIPLWPWDHHDCFSGFHLQQLSPSFSSLWCLQEASHPIYLVGLKEETGKTPLALPSITSKYFFFLSARFLCCHQHLGPYCLHRTLDCWPYIIWIISLSSLMHENKQTKNEVSV